MDSVRRRLVRTLATATLMVSAPAAAFAVSVSSGDGSGTQYRQISYNNGAYVSGFLKSAASGRAVYYSGKVVWYNWFCSNTTVGRYTSNTTSTTSVVKAGYITATPSPGCSSIKVQSRVCRDVQLLPDACGAWSPEY
ncbi:hypothetical protein GCM10027053_14090 [Intrasporangium mesophilum]